MAMKKDDLADKTVSSQQQMKSLEGWLTHDVAMAYDACKREPSRSLTIAQVKTELDRLRHPASPGS